MGRAKKKRKRLAKLKRLKRKSQGKLVIFDLQNSPKKMKGCSNKYSYKTNIHNLIYKDASFENVRFRASNITDCNFKNAHLIGVDFVSSNLKNSNFSNATLEDVVFFGCKLKGVIFHNTEFKNVFFISTNTNGCKYINDSEECTIINRYTVEELSPEIEVCLAKLATYKSIYIPHVIHVKKDKTNYWITNLLLKQCGDTYTFKRVLQALCKRKDKRYFYTVYAYKKFIDNYLKR